MGKYDKLTFQDFQAKGTLVLVYDDKLDFCCSFSCYVFCVIAVLKIISIEKLRW